MSSVKAKMITPHADLGDDTYHEWYVNLHAGLVRADKRGRPNPRMIFAEWVKVECNNLDCAAWGIVHHDAIAALVDEALA